MKSQLKVNIGKRNRYGCYEHIKTISIGDFESKSKAIKKSINWLNRNSGEFRQYATPDALLDVCSFYFGNSQITNDVSKAIN